jgi:glycosyltransferase involved in cell wall biosynthesis
MFNFNKQIIVCHPIPELLDFLNIEPSLDSKKVCFVGSLIYWKGLDLLPKITDRIHSKLNWTKFFIIGGGKLKELKDREGVKGLWPHASPRVT